MASGADRLRAGRAPAGSTRSSPSVRQPTGNDRNPVAGRQPQPGVVTGEILRFKVQLRDIRPAIWRRIEVAAGHTFWDLHVAIQDAMGWLDSHLHAFYIKARLTLVGVALGLTRPCGSDTDHDVVTGGH